MSTEIINGDASDGQISETQIVPSGDAPVPQS